MAPFELMISGNKAHPDLNAQVRSQAVELWRKRAVRLACAAVATVLALLVICLHFLADYRRMVAMMGMAGFLGICATDLRVRTHISLSV